MHKRRLAQWFAVAALLGLAPPAAAQQGVSGVVVDQLGAAIVNARVNVVGTPLGAQTDADGRFEIRNISGRTEVTLEVVIIGYRPLSLVVPVGATAIRIVVQRAAIRLDAIVVTGTAGGAAKREVGNAVSGIEVAEIAAMAPVQNIGQLINGRAAGVVVAPPEGSAGGGVRIMIRGRSSLALSIAPLIYVDGIRVDNTQTGGVFGGRSSRLNDFSIDEIENIEIIKGPAAATLYGTEASNGVIQIITKKGRPGATRIGVSIRQGVAFFANPEGRMPINFFDDPATGEVIPFNITQQETDRGTPLFRTGHLQGYAVNLSGGSEAVQYFSSIEYDRNQGAIETDLYERVGGRLNVTAAVNDKFDINAQLGFSLSRTEFPDFRIMFDTELSRPSTRNTPQRGFFRAPSEATNSQFDHRQNVDRLTTGFELHHRPTGWLSHRLRTGIDISNQNNIDLVLRMTPEFARFYSPALSAGTKTFSQVNLLSTTVDYSATADFPLTSSLRSATTGGFQYYRRNATLLSATGLQFPAPDVTSIAGAATTVGSDDVIENVTVGVFIQEQISWKDRLFLTAAVRGDDNSAFGEDFEFVTYPKFGASWVIGEEPWWNVSFVDALRLRVAWGKSGQQPDAFAALRTFAPITAQASEPGVTPQFVGNPDLEPEKSQEIELGFEAALFNQRLGIDFTFYQQNTKDAILARDVSPSTGFPGSQFINAGEVRNRGIELLLNANIIQTENFGFDLGINLSRNVNEVVSLGLEGVEFLSFGFGNRFMPGYPVYAVFSRKIIAADAGPGGVPINIMCDGGLPDGMPSGVPVDCATAPHVYSGDGVDPNFEGSVMPSFSLFQRLTISGLLDFKVNYRRWTSVFWCPGILDCEEEVFPERFDPVKAASSVLGLVDDIEWFRDMSFAKLREISVSYLLPDKWARAIGASRAQIMVAGRNLHTWTGFQGLDPESESLFPEAGTFGTPFEQNEVPQLRQFVTKINLTF